MLPKYLRLKSSDIPAVARKGKRIGNEALDIRVLPANNTPQFAIIVSKKTASNATTRNRITRRIKAALLQLVKEERIPAGKYIIIARSADLAITDFNVYLALGSLF